LFSVIPSLCFSLSVKDQITLPCKIGDKVFEEQTRRQRIQNI
jgi:hypothetical protein